MSSLSRVSAIIVLASVLSTLSNTQVATGTPRLGTFGGGPDVINFANLNVHFAFPVHSRDGRGLPFMYALTYDTSVWNPVTVGSTTLWSPVPNWGWSKSHTSVLTGQVTYKATFCGGMRYTNWVYHDPAGTQHSIPVTVGNCPGDSPSATVTASDGYKYTVTIFGPTVTVFTPSGTTIVPPVTFNADPGSVTDANGNRISTTGTVITDTLGTTALTISGTAPNPVSYTYTAPSGAAASVVVNYTTFSVRTNFGVAGISEWGPTNVALVSSIVYPDGTSFQFTYQDTPGFPGNKTGRIASVTLPTGGTISYQWAGGWDGIFMDGTTAGFYRTTPDGTSLLWTSGSGQTHVIDPSNNETLLHFTGGFETQREVYQGYVTTGTLLHKTITCHNGVSAGTCGAGATFSPPIVNRVKYPLFPSTGLSSRHDEYFDSFGRLFQKDDYDFGYAFLRRTVITYASLGNNILDKPASITIQDLSGNPKAQTNFAYDQWPLTATSGTPHHFAVTGSRGNLTTVSSWVGGSTFHNRTFSYFDTGTPNQTTDINGAVTSFVFGPGSCGNSFVTQVNMPLTLSRSFTYNCTGGVPISETDENGKTQSASFTDLAFWRPSLLTDKAGLQTAMSFTGATVSESNFTFGTSLVNSLNTLDNLGRPKFQQQRQATGSAQFNSVHAEYDSLGRPFRVSMPYVAGQAQTYPVGTPVTTTTYDPMSRPAQISDAGGGTSTFTYNQNDVLITLGPAPAGENTKRKQYEYDSLGRLTSVCELTTVTGSGTCGQTVNQTGYWTRYQYDMLGNLTQVTQNAQSASPQTRTFVYDKLSRLTAETNPETGTITYVWDIDFECG